MKITQLIKELQEIYEANNNTDLEVVLCDNNSGDYHKISPYRKGDDCIFYTDTKYIIEIDLKE